MGSASRADRIGDVSLIETEVRDGVAIVTLNDPERRNALNLDMVTEMEAAFDDLESRPDDVGAVIVTGSPPAFCAGADLSHLGDSREAGLRRIYEGFLRVGRSPLPTLAAVNGAAVGAGMNLALVCDVRIAGERARFDTRFVDLGLHPGGGHTWMYRNITGPQAVFATAVFGEIMNGREAERTGLVWKCVPDGELAEAAFAMAARAAGGPRELVRRVKETIIDMADVKTHDAAVDRELVPQVWSLDQPDFAERMAALRKKISSK